MIASLDDVRLPYKLERQLDCLRSDPEVGIVGCGCALVDAPGDRENKGVEQRAEGFVVSRMFECTGPVCCKIGYMMIRRDIFQNLGGLDKRLLTCEDWDFTFRIASANKLRFIPEILWR